MTTSPPFSLASAPEMSVIYHVPPGTRLLPRKLAELAASVGETETEFLVVEANASADAASRLAQECMQAVRLVDTTDCETTGQALDRAIQKARGTLLAYADARAYLQPGVLNELRRAVKAQSGRNAAFALLPGANAPSGEASDYTTLASLLLEGISPACMIWKQSAPGRTATFDPTRNEAAVLDFLLAFAAQGGLYAMPGLTTARSATKQITQQAQDENEDVFAKHLAHFVDTGMRTLSAAELEWEYANSAKTVMRLIEGLQNGEQQQASQLSLAMFSYTLLALRHRQVDIARQMLDTAFTLMSEQPGLMRLYKLLVLRHPIAPTPLLGSSPKVSVYIPLYNQGQYLEGAVQSVLNQTHSHWDMVIVDDGSTDNSLEIAHELLDRIKDPRIRLVSQANTGKGGARNRGLRETDGPYVVCLDADDLFAPDYLAVAAEMLDNNAGLGWITPKTLVFGANNHIAWAEEYDFVRSLLLCPSPSSSVIRRKAFEPLGYFRNDMTNREDAEAWLQLGEQGWTTQPTNIPLFLYRHAVRRPGLRNISNVPSKEEFCSLHPWWYRLDLPREMRLKAYTTFETLRLPPWFLNTDNAARIARCKGDSESFVRTMETIKAEYPPVYRPRRWDDAADDSYLETRRELYDTSGIQPAAGRTSHPENNQ